ncbi:Aste57867_12114 [Aphanomyces stellatus]|uniref:Aste57867_12114 protein n=1 Tax=Aphanomyces stellatus TaxID=120398 RepID=A0A485KWQ1_9STRA|nr:hypothetical protein As57867_012069 [Aphanomyces stellatus]VFT88968.1 Aste57867_12114 [Aphanomyces stellatus]
MDEDAGMMWVQRRLKYVEKQIETLPHKFLCALDDRESGSRDLATILERVSRRLDTLEATMLDLPDHVVRVMKDQGEPSIGKPEMVDGASQTTHPVAYGFQHRASPSMFRRRQSVPNLRVSTQVETQPVDVGSSADSDNDDYWQQAIKSPRPREMDVQVRQDDKQVAHYKPRVYERDTRPAPLMPKSPHATITMDGRRSFEQVDAASPDPFEQGVTPSVYQQHASVEAEPAVMRPTTEPSSPEAAHHVEETTQRERPTLTTTALSDDDAEQTMMVMRLKSPRAILKTSNSFERAARRNELKSPRVTFRQNLTYDEDPRHLEQEQWRQFQQFQQQQQGRMGGKSPRGAAAQRPSNFGEFDDDGAAGSSPQRPSIGLITNGSPTATLQVAPRSPIQVSNRVPRQRRSSSSSASSSSSSSSVTLEENLTTRQADEATPQVVPAEAAAHMKSPRKSPRRVPKQWNWVEEQRRAGLKSPRAGVQASLSSWRFPVTRCDILWHHWFHGDTVKGPFRFLTHGDVVGPDNFVLFLQAKGVMDALVDVAIESGVADSIDDIVTKSPVVSKAVFQYAFGRLVALYATHADFIPIPEWTFVQVFDTINQNLAAYDDGDDAFEPEPSHVSETEIAANEVVALVPPSPPHPPQALAPDMTLVAVFAPAADTTSTPSPTAIPPVDSTQDPVDPVEYSFGDDEHVQDDDIDVDDLPPSSSVARITAAALSESDSSSIVSSVAESSMAIETLTNTTTPVGEFTWSDQTTHRAPEGWRWPSVPCRDMWQLWFRGDPASQLGPFRLLQPSDMCGTSKDIYCYSKIAMQKLVDIALANLLVRTVVMLEGMADDDADHPSLMAVFDKAYEILLHKNPEGNLVGPGRDQLRPDSATPYAARTIGHRISKLQVARRSELSYEWPDGIARRTPPGWEFPAGVTCKVMWVLWFRGDARSRIGPFYDLREVDCPLIQSRAELLRARYVMTTLIEIAIKHKCAASLGVLEQMPLAVLMDVFLKAFKLVAHKIPENLRVGDDTSTTSAATQWKDGTLTCQRVYTAYQNRRRKPAPC